MDRPRWRWRWRWRMMMLDCSCMVYAPPARLRFRFPKKLKLGEGITTSGLISCCDDTAGVSAAVTMHGWRGSDDALSPLLLACC